MKIDVEQFKVKPGEPTSLEDFPTKPDLSHTNDTEINEKLDENTAPLVEL